MSRILYSKVLLFLASVVIASAQASAYLPPSLTSLGPISSKIGYAGVTLTAPVTVTVGGGPISLQGIVTYSGPSQVFPTFSSEAGIRVTIHPHFAAGSYRLESILFLSSNGPTMYRRNGEISYTTPEAGWPPRHSVDFSVLDFSIVAVPQITQHPVSMLTLAGQTAALTVTVDPSTPANIQWKKNGIAIPGATRNRLSFEPVTLSDAGTYEAFLDNSGATATSLPAVLAVDAGRIKNISVRNPVAESGTLTAGLVLDNVKAVLIRGVGRSLEQFGVPAGTTLPNPVIDVVNSSGVIVAQNDDAPTNGALTSATTRVGAFPLSSAQDAAMVVTLPAGSYTVRLKDAGGRGGDALLEIYDAN